MYAADEEGPEAERLRLYDVQWLDEPSIAQARIGEEHLIRKHAGLSEDALSTWITKHADVEAIQAGLASSPPQKHHSRIFMPRAIICSSFSASSCSSSPPVPTP